MATLNIPLVFCCGTSMFYHISCPLFLFCSIHVAMLGYAINLFGFYDQSFCVFTRKGFRLVRVAGNIRMDMPTHTHILHIQSVLFRIQFLASVS